METVYLVWDLEAEKIEETLFGVYRSEDAAIAAIKNELGADFDEDFEEFFEIEAYDVEG